MPLHMIARINEKALASTLLKGQGRDAAHLLTHLWAKLKKEELDKSKLEEGRK